MSDIYPSARELAATTGIGWATNNIRIVLVDVAYVYDPTDDFLDDVAAGARVATSGNLASKTTTGGVCDADDVAFVALSGDDVTGIIVYNHTGVESTSDLICHYDRLSTGSLIDFVPGGLDATVRWSNGATKMFQL
jgi:hypothetical protein